MRSDWQAVAIVGGTPHRLLQGVSAHAENHWLVGVCQRALVARKGAPAKNPPAGIAAPAKVAAASPAPASPAPAKAAPTAAGATAMPAEVEEAFTTLRAAGAQEVERLVGLVRPFASHLRAPISSVLPEATRRPQLRAILPREGQPTFGEQHLAYRPDDFRKRIWVRHIDQVVPLFQLEAENVLRMLRYPDRVAGWWVPEELRITLENIQRKNPIVGPRYWPGEQIMSKHGKTPPINHARFGIIDE